MRLCRGPPHFPAVVKARAETLALRALASRPSFRSGDWQSLPIRMRRPALAGGLARPVRLLAPRQPVRAKRERDQSDPTDVEPGTLRHPAELAGAAAVAIGCNGSGGWNKGGTRPAPGAVFGSRS